MTKHEIFNVWAPQGVVWSDWVKPVLFACMQEHGFSVPPEPAEIPEIIFPLESDMAIVLDLPGSLGVSIGMIAARAGYRPVPLYNALPAPNEELLGMAPVTVPSVLNILRALQDATSELSQLPIQSLAPPVFLLDADRRGGNAEPRPGVFDNRSVSFTTDFPSANFLHGHRIGRALLVRDYAVAPQPDVAHTLLKWQEGGIVLYSEALFDAADAAPLTVSKPSHFGRAWHRVLLALGLRRGKLGGFGGIVPQPSSG